MKRPEVPSIAWVPVPPPVTMWFQRPRRAKRPRRHECVRSGYRPAGLVQRRHHLLKITPVGLYAATAQEGAAVGELSDDLSLEGIKLENERRSFEISSFAFQWCNRPGHRVSHGMPWLFPGYLIQMDDRKIVKHYRQPGGARAPPEAEKGAMTIVLLGAGAVEHDHGLVSQENRPR